MSATDALMRVCGLKVWSGLGERGLEGSMIGGFCSREMVRRRAEEIELLPSGSTRLLEEDEAAIGSTMGWRERREVCMLSGPGLESELCRWVMFETRKSPCRSNKGISKRKGGKKERAGFISYVESVSGECSLRASSCGGAKARATRKVVGTQNLESGGIVAATTLKKRGSRSKVSGRRREKPRSQTDHIHPVIGNVCQC